MRQKGRGLDACQVFGGRAHPPRPPVHSVHQQLCDDWRSPPAGFDWFDDAQWKVVAANAQLLTRVAQAGCVRGICFDPEPYDFGLWEYRKQPGAAGHSFADYRAKVRQRGADLMPAFEQPMPGALILSFFHVSLFDRFADLPESERARRLARDSWGLMPDFFVGSARGRYARGPVY